MFGYPFGYSRYSPSDEYAQALAEERAARNQYAAALRAQEEARSRAARARLAQQTFTSPYNSYLPDAMDDDDENSFLSGHNFPSGYGFGMSPQRRRALVEEQRRRQLMELEQERQRKVLEEEQVRRRMLEQQRLHEEERVKGQRGLEQFYGDFGFRGTESDQPVPGPPQSRSASPTQRQPTPPVEPAASAQHPPPASPEEVAAATKIQTVYRAHALHQKALSDLASLGARFDTLRSSFHPSTKVEFKGSNSEPVLVDISVSPSAISDLDDDPSPIPSLTYSSINTPIHQYEEELNRLLTALDAVESGGDRKIRESRRELVKKVEKEAQRLERWKVTVWRAGRTTHGENNSTIPTISQPENPSEGIPEAVSLDLQETPLHTEHPEATPEPEEPSLSVATAEEPFFDASATLEDNASEDMGSVLIPSPSGSLPETDKFGSCMERRIDGLGRPKSPLVGQGWDVLDVFDML